MKFRNGAASVCIFLLLVAFLAGVTTQTLSAQVSIPEGSTINSAQFSIYSQGSPNYQTIVLHRITADWGEYSVNWNTFAASFDSSVTGTFTVNASGWQTVDLTSLVQAWVNDLYPNFGIVLMQGLTPHNIYNSSEALTVELRPKLEIHYTSPTGVSGQIVIQRPAAEADGVADAYIWELYPAYNGGGSDSLWTGNVDEKEKYSLLRFHFTVRPPAPGTGTPGFWKNHPEAWPDAGVTIGGVYYSKETAIELMNMSVRGDKTFTMFDALVAAKLNVLAGNDDSCIASYIDQADAWMSAYPVGSGVAAGGSQSPWRVGNAISMMLDSYNNGLLDCAEHREGSAADQSGTVEQTVTNPRRVTPRRIVR
jgi:hypothetical protein